MHYTVFHLNGLNLIARSFQPMTTLSNPVSFHRFCVHLRCLTFPMTRILPSATRLPFVQRTKGRFVLSSTWISFCRKAIQKEKKKSTSDAVAIFAEDTLENRGPGTRCLQNTSHRAGWSRNAHMSGPLNRKETCCRRGQDASIQGH